MEEAAPPILIPLPHSFMRWTSNNGPGKKLMGDALVTRPIEILSVSKGAPTVELVSTICGGLVLDKWVYP